MRVFVTGGTGYLGSRLVPALLESGHEVRLLLRRPGETALPNHERLTPVPGDVRDIESLKAGAKNCQVVLHLAAFVRNWSRRRRDFDDVNVGGFALAARAALERGVERFVHTSSFLALGPAPPEKPRTEEDPPAPSRGATDYARTKALAERERDWIEGQGLRVVSLYPTVLYGPGSLTAGNLVGRILVDWLRGGPAAFAGDGSRVWNYVFIDDVVRAHLAVVEGEPPHRRYIVAGENATQREFLSRAAGLMGRRAPRRGIPFGVLSAAGWALLGSAWLTGKEPQITPAIARTFREHWAFDGSRARRELGIHPTPILEGLAATLAWAREMIESGRR
jgi:farnesol dehydrogenase